MDLNNISSSNYLVKEFLELFKNNVTVKILQAKFFDAFWYLDLENGNQWISPRLWTFVGYENLKLQQTYKKWLEIVDSEDLENAKKIMKLYLKDDSSEYKVILRCKHKDGSTVYVESQAIQIIKKDGKPIRVLGVNKNITEAVNYKNQKVKSNILDKKNKDLEKKNQQLTEFSYLTSHDLQSPLNTIISYLSILEDEKAHMNEITQFSFEAINKSAYRMKTFIKSLLQYIVIGEDRETEVFKIHNVLEEITTSLTSLIKETKAEIHIEGDDFEINGHRQDYYRILFNLVNNALKYISKQDTPQIRINLKETAKNYEFTVSDNGIGIDEKDFDIIFDAFKRLHSKDEYEGTGIGLAECKKIVNLNNGNIWVTSEIDKGSTFYVSIPKS